ncbi:MAG: ferric reductase-like transmembrane domain-containing protein [Prevotellaceae bacterium]|jgi:DMSO/TMAO reductase YedYZ heme-binding membrane subunit|nr:ferric reductase-like transmembrane domain-containing protein [Prevotellaceae bacterium]
MIKLLIEFIQFLYSTLPLITSTGVFALLAVLLSKSIKRHATAYYIALSAPCLMVAVPFVVRMFDVETFNFIGIPFLGGILRDYIHIGTLGFPLLIIIMYVGALNPKNRHVKKLLVIRKELSVISGFPVLTHSLIRVFNNFPNALRFFTDNDEYMASTKVTSVTGAAITNFSFVLGILMLAIFIPLWVTSFDFVRKRMGNASWKKLQRWAYVLYAMLFIHAMGIQTGFLLNPRNRDIPKQEQAAERIAPNSENTGVRRNAERPERRGGSTAETDDRRAAQTEPARPARSGHARSIGFSDIKFSHATQRYIHIASLLLIFGSYLYLRLKRVIR